MPPVMSLLLGARDLLGQELTPATVSFEFLLAYDFDFDADGVLNDEDAGIHSCGSTTEGRLISGHFGISAKAGHSATP